MYIIDNLLTVYTILLYREKCKRSIEPVFSKDNFMIAVK